MAFVHVETLEQIAERLGWSAQQLKNARAGEAQARKPNLTERDYARAEVLSKAMKRTRRELDEAS